MTYYNLFNRPTEEDLEPLSLTSADVTLSGKIINKGDRALHVRAKRTGELRSPKKGEWFLSGAIPEACRAKYDSIHMHYAILELVIVEIRIVTTEKEIGREGVKSYVATQTLTIGK